MKVKNDKKLRGRVNYLWNSEKSILKSLVVSTLKESECDVVKTGEVSFQNVIIEKKDNDVENVDGHQKKCPLKDSVDISRETLQKARKEINC